ncbi:MAG: protein phosphatase 2C domain-containing protein [Oscillatoriales cyanobacterium]|uniref:PP2C family serine/threonine-protein phosphatase n=1 Tax=Microcoleus sp. PH2017_05_CCC_O_A TaxID=2798816 RepID=UPI001DA44D8F|nr:PP2C family serine/threonine-protein phosphatase [Microcoleus sp. PH2017_05_CCC_O_A]MCC3439079.1 protein phosphatase 2C domain-containing protein [Microcoleus sp. PH2017_05_CCC_O_A]TAG19361.1 MAG: protein phosphatase 2C domain-containing protein [Oscillatoriales cyanobacterium]
MNKKKPKAAKKASKEKSIGLTVEEFNELQRKYPDSREALNDAISAKQDDNFYIRLTKLKNQQSKLGNDAVPDALIKEISSRKKNKNFRKPKQDQNSKLAQENDSVENKIPEQIKWQGICATTVGRSHLQSHPQIECQDAAKVVSTPRAAIFVADGAGCARLSHLGSKSVVEELAGFINSKQATHGEILDQEQIINCNDSDRGKEYAYKFVKYAVEGLRKLANTEDCSVEDLKCTLLMAVSGKFYIFWLKVGDGFIVVEKDNKLELLGSLGKGEFANQTTFLSESLNDKAISYGFLPAENVTGIAAFTDGAGETLVTTHDSKIAGELSNFFAQMRGGSLDNDSLLKFLEDETVWASPKGFDDRGIALLAQSK